MKSVLPIFILVLQGLFFVSASAQNRALDFDKPLHDFATIAEDGGVVSHTFSCTNSLSKPVVILKVSAGCSCTTVDYSREPIRPNEQRAITVHFDPMHQPEGKFFRKVIINTSEGNIPLSISGVITPRKKDISEQYPIALESGLRLEANAHAFGYIEHEVVTRSSIGVINTSSKPITLKLVPVSTSGALDIRYPTVLQPKQRAAIDFGYNISKRSDIYGSLQEVYDIEIDHKKSYHKVIISGIAIDKRELSSDKEWQKIQLSENFIKFGTLKRSATEVCRAIEIYNIGLEPLIIRKIECTNASFRTKLSGRTSIPKDGKSTLIVAFDPSESDFGAITGRITIISNDPQQPTKSFRVSAIVEN